MKNKRKFTSNSQDNYAYGMDWGENKVSIGDLSNYRQYQYDLVRNYVGQEILEVGCGASRSFTKKILTNKSDIKRLLSIEPSEILIKEFSENGMHEFPKYVELRNLDILGLDPEETGLFDTVFYIHVLEHIEDDRAALNHTSSFLKENGHLLIEVPALQFLYSAHDEALGHYRRYNKKMLKAAIDEEKYLIKRIWYNDPIGILGSFFFI